MISSQSTVWNLRFFFGLSPICTCLLSVLLGGKFYTYGRCMGNREYHGQGLWPCICGRWNALQLERGNERPRAHPSSTFDILCFCPFSFCHQILSALQLLHIPRWITNQINSFHCIHHLHPWSLLRFRGHAPPFLHYHVIQLLSLLALTPHLEYHSAHIEPSSNSSFSFRFKFGTQVPFGCWPWCLSPQGKLWQSLLVESYLELVHENERWTCEIYNIMASWSISWSHRRLRRFQQAPWGLW